MREMVRGSRAGMDDEGEVDGWKEDLFFNFFYVATDFCNEPYRKFPHTENRRSHHPTFFATRNRIILTLQVIYG